MADLPNPNPGVSTDDFNAAQSVHFKFMEINANILSDLDVELENLNYNFLSWADAWNKESLDAKRARMEAALEAKKDIKTSGNTKKSKMEIPGMGMGILGFAGIAGLIASLTNLDDIINSIKLPGRILAVGGFLTNFGTLLKDTFKLKNLEKLLPKFTLPKMEETTKLLSKWFNGGIEKIKNL
jgi:hypothetical protein